jgi:signal transduction histidine kinase
MRKEEFKELDYSNPNRLWELSLHINNYLSAVIGSAELLRKKKNLDEKERHYLEIIERNGEKIKRALEDFSTEKTVMEKKEKEAVLV